MDAIKNMSMTFKKIFYSKSKISKFILVLGIIGIALIFLSEIIPQENKKELKQTENNIYFSYERETELEKRLAEMISKISGAGKTSVMLTLESSKEFFYASEVTNEIRETENEKSNDTEKSFVIIDGENGEEPLIIKVDEAKIRGVLIVCEGGDNAIVIEKIIDAVCAVLGISSNRVSVSKMA